MLCAILLYIVAEHHLLRVSSDKMFSIVDSDSVVINNQLHPIIVEEIKPIQGTELKSFGLKPLEKDKLTNHKNNSTTITSLLDLPGRNQRSISIDSGIRSCSGLEIESPQPQEISNKQSSIVSVFVKQAPNHPEEADSVLSLDKKTEDEKNVIIRKRSFSGCSSNNDASTTSLQTNSSKKEETDNQTPSTSGQSEEEGREENGVVVLEDDNDDGEGIVNIIPPKGWLKIIAYILLFPLIVLLYFTLPNVKKQVSYPAIYFLPLCNLIFILCSSSDSDGGVSFRMSLSEVFCGLGCFPTSWSGGQLSSVILLTFLPL